jgi:hypothetical protein
MIAGSGEMETHHLIIDCAQLANERQKYKNDDAKKASGQQSQRRRYLAQIFLNQSSRRLSETAVVIEPAPSKWHAKIKHNRDERRDGKQLC